MDWKEETIRNAYLGILSVIGIFLLKKAKPAWNNAKKISNLLDTIDELKTKITELQDEIYIIKAESKAVLHTSVFPSFIMDKNMDLIYANPALAEAFGFQTITDAHSKGYLRAIPEENREQLEQEVDRLKDHPSSYEDYIKFQHIQNKKFIYTKCRSEPVRNKKKEVIYTIGRIHILTQKP